MIHLYYFKRFVTHISVRLFTLTGLCTIERSSGIRFHCLAVLYHFCRQRTSPAADVF